MIFGSCFAMVSLSGKQCIAVHFFKTGNATLYGSGTWQAGQTRKGFANWQAVSESGPAPISAPARWEHLPNPEITLHVSCAFSRFQINNKSAQIDSVVAIGPTL